MLPKGGRMQRAIAGWLGTALLVAACVGTAAAWQESEQAPPPPPPKEDSLVEAARKAKAKKLKLKPGKVYSEDDLSDLQKGTISIVGEKSSAASPEAEDSSPPSDISPPPEPGALDEAYWRGRAQKLRDQLALLDAEIKPLKEQVEKTGGAGYDPQSGLNDNVIYIVDLNAKLQRLEKRRQELLAQMDALLEEARKAGVSPGWLR